MKFNLSLLFLFLSVYIWAQPAVSEGKLFYEITYQNLSPEVKRHEHLLPHDASFYFKNEKTRMEMGVGYMGKNSTIHDGIKKQNIVLLNIYGKKFALIKPDSEMLELKKSMGVDTLTQITKVEITDTYKKIADYSCRKAIVYRSSPSGEKMNECWFTKELPPYNTENESGLKAINGFLMQYNISENGMTMTMTVKLVTRVPIDDSLFEIPTGYQIVTETELDRILSVMQLDH